MYASLAVPLFSAKCTAGPNILGFFFPGAWHWALQKPPLLKPPFLGSQYFGANSEHNSRRTFENFGEWTFELQLFDLYQWTRTDGSRVAIPSGSYSTSLGGFLCPVRARRNRNSRATLEIAGYLQDRRALSLWRFQNKEPCLMHLRRMPQSWGSLSARQRSQSKRCTPKGSCGNTAF